MLTTTRTMLAIASLLTASAAAMASPTTDRTHRADSQVSVPFNARAQAPETRVNRSQGRRYDPSSGAFRPDQGPGDLLFERAKGGIE